MRALVLSWLMLLARAAPGAMSHQIGQLQPGPTQPTQST